VALEAAVHSGELPAGTALSGPALCALPEATLLVPPGWSGEVDEHGTIRLHRDTGLEACRAGPEDGGAGARA